ncbi:MAG TPA: hypothetical protein VGJ70_05205 [Solirubrobacteraceae bacterium]|jgi:dihydrofolate reductase
MRRLILLEHVSLDGYLAGPDGEMDWIRVDDELWDYVHPVVDAADTAVWGRVTYDVLLGAGARLFPEAGPTLSLRLVTSRPMASGVVGLHYAAT